MLSKMMVIFDEQQIDLQKRYNQHSDRHMVNEKSLLDTRKQLQTAGLFPSQCPTTQGPCSPQADSVPASRTDKYTGISP
jgi:hypothetical protein